MAAIETGAKYWIYNPTQTEWVTFNDPTDSKFVGYINDITGLDDSGVRENAQSVVAGDGGYHGPFWEDRRPWTMSGFIYPTFPTTARSAAQTALQGVMSKCLRADGYLMWLPSDGITKFLRFRKQQPTRITPGQSNVEKTFQIAGVAADYRIYASGAPKTISATSGYQLYTATCVNNGNADAPPVFTFSVSGGIVNPIIQNDATLKQLLFNHTFDSRVITIDLTQTYPTVTDAFGTDYSGYVDPINSDWSIAVTSVPDAAPFDNTFSLFSTTGGYLGGGTANLQIAWNDAYV